jgi:hypothetical protein
LGDFFANSSGRPDPPTPIFLGTGNRFENEIWKRAIKFFAAQLIAS